jgi:hypothetical protein
MSSFHTSHQLNSSIQDNTNSASDLSRRHGNLSSSGASDPLDSTTDTLDSLRGDFVGSSWQSPSNGSASFSPPPGLTQWDVVKFETSSASVNRTGNVSNSALIEDQLVAAPRTSAAPLRYPPARAPSAAARPRRRAAARADSPISR